MTSGPSKEFKVKLDRKAIAAITQMHSMRQLLTMAETGFLQSATMEEVQTAKILSALKEYLEERRCEPDFEVVLSE